MSDKLIKSIQQKYKMILSDYKYCKGSSIRDEKVGGYIKYTTRDGIIKGYGIYAKNYGSVILLKNINFNKVWKITLNDYFIFYKSHVSISDIKRKLMLELIERFDKKN